MTVIPPGYRALVDLSPDPTSIESARQRAERMAFLFPWMTVRVRCPPLFVFARQPS